MSNVSGFSLLTASAVLMGLSNLCLKAAIARVPVRESLINGVARQPVFICGVLLFAAASLVYMRVLTSVALSTAYPVFVSIAFAVVIVGASLGFGEPVTATKLLGSALLVAGIGFISRG